jgi:hypothetical protein
VEDDPATVRCRRANARVRALLAGGTFALVLVTALRPLDAKPLPNGASRPTPSWSPTRWHTTDGGSVPARAEKVRVAQAETDSDAAPKPGGKESNRESNPASQPTERDARDASNPASQPTEREAGEATGQPPERDARDASNPASQPTEREAGEATGQPPEQGAPLGGVAASQPALQGIAGTAGSDKGMAERPKATQPGQRCQSDDQCPSKTYCDEGRCRALERPFNLLYLYYRSGDRRMHEILGLYWHRRGQRGYRVIFPLYWHFWQPESRTQVLFPFYWRFDDHEAGASNIIVPPVQWSRRGKRRALRIWPLVFWSDEGVRRSSLTVLPFLHRSRRDSRTTTIAPLLLSGWQSDEKTKASRGLAAGLWYWHSYAEPGQPGYLRTRALFPLFFSRARNDRSFTWAFPLNFHWRDGERRSLLLFPLFYRNVSSRSSRAISVIPPLYYSRVADRRRVIAPPLLYHWSDSSSRHTLVLPLFYHQATRRGRNSRLFSPIFLYERDEDAKVRQWALLAPPYYRRRDPEREIDTLFPLFWRWHNKQWQSTTYLLGPLVSQSDPDGASRALFPLAWHFEDKKLGSSSSVLFPLAYHSRRPDGSVFDLLFPFYYGRGPKHWKAGLFPLLFAGQRAKEHHAVLFPLFWRFGSTSGSTTVVGPWYYRSNDSGWSTALLPLFFAGRHGPRSHQVLFPFYWHFRDRQAQSSTHVLGPAFYHRAKQTNAYGLLPLFAAARTKDTRLATIPPLLFYYRTKNGDRTARGRPDWSLLAGPYYAQRSESQRTDILFPLMYYRRTSNRQETTAALLPLFYYQRQAKRTTLVTPIGGFRRDRQARLSQGVIGPVVWHRDRKRQALAVLPLFFHHRNEEERAETSVLFPLAVRHVAPTRTAHVVFPIFWRLTSPKERSLVIFPLLWQLRQREGEDIDVLFPLYWRFRNTERRLTIAGPVFWHARGEERTAGVLPLALYRRGQKSSYLAALPFFCYAHDFETGKRTWVVGPAYYRSYRRGYAAGLAPVLFRKKTPEKGHTIVAPLYWRFWNTKAQTALTVAGPLFHQRSKERRSWGIAPLFYRSSDSAGGRTTAVAPLFYYRREPAKQALYTAVFGFHRSKDYAVWYAGPYLNWRSRWRALDVFFPLGFRNLNRKSGETTLFTLPGYFGRWKEGSSLHIAFPLFWRRKTIEQTNTVVFPIYWDFHDRYRQRTTALLPFFVRHADYAKKSSWILTPPGLWLRSRPDGNDAVVFPLVWHFGQSKRSSTVVFPLYWDFKREKRRSTVLFPFYWRFDRPDARTTIVFNTYYRRNKRDGTYNFHFFPFFQLQRRRVGDIRVDVLAGLFGYERIGRNRILTLLFFPIALKPAPARARAPDTSRRSAAIMPHPARQH